MSGPVSTIADVWQREVADAGREPAVFVLTAFLVTFGITRAITHAIRAQRVPFLRDVSLGGTHLHHLVPGIFLLLIAGLLGIAVEAPLQVWVVPVLFGIGAALTLDEFALWLHLKDVYWTDEGRRSVDAVVIAAALFGLSIIGYQFWHGVWTDVVRISETQFAGYHVLGLILAVVALSKGKLFEAVIGALVVPVAAIGALRLATPASPWARRRYGEEKMARSRSRYGAARGVWGVAREVEVAAARPGLNWRWLVRYGIILAVTVLITVDSLVREPTVSTLVIVGLVVLGLLAESTRLRRRVRHPGDPAPQASGPAPEEDAPRERPAPSRPGPGGRP